MLNKQFEFTATTGCVVFINPDRIDYVKQSGTKTLIRFNNENWIEVCEPVRKVMDKLVGPVEEPRDE